jgi:CelD/BcsL family acetyltransferase involved in cellulose biosynthesis
MLKIKHITNLLAFKEIKAEWESFEGNYTVFQTWLWNFIWTKTVLENNKKYFLDIQLIYKNNELVAIFPFFYEKYAFLNIKLYHFLGHRMSYHNDVLLSKKVEHNDIDALIEFFLENLTFNSIMLLRHMNEEAIFTRKLIELNYAEPQCKRLIVKNDITLSDQSNRFKKKVRGNYRRRLNKFKKEYDYIIRVNKGSDARRAFNKVIDLHLKRFHSQGKETLLEGDNLLFMNEILEESHEKIDFEVIELFNGNEVVASKLMIKDGDSYYYINGGFDPKYSQYSPLMILITVTMDRGFNELLCQNFDLGAGYEKYKYDWDPTIKQNYFCCLCSNNLYSKSIAACIKAMFRRKLPPDPRL